MVKIALALFSAFAVYTIAVYAYCDAGNKEKAPTMNVRAGWHVWQEKNCQSCHQLYGLGGYLGPDLTNVASDTMKDERYLRTFIKYGTGRMPDLHLADEEVNDVIAFLKWVDKSGKSKIDGQALTRTGNYDLTKTD